MISGRDTGRPNDVFQAGHYGWFYTDERGIARGPYKTERKVKFVRDQARDLPALLSQSGQAIWEGRLIDVDAASFRLRADERKARKRRSAPSRAATLATRRPVAKPKARTKSRKSRAASKK